MTTDRIDDLQYQIEKMLSNYVDAENGHEVKASLMSASQYLVDATNCIKEAKAIYLKNHAAWLRQHETKLAGMKPSAAKLFVDTSCVDEQILLVRCEQNYKNLCKYSDNLVTILSYLKAEMTIN